MDIVAWVKEHWDELAAIYSGIVTITSIIVKLIPPLPQGHWALPIVKFLARFIALNTKSPTNYERLAGEWNK